eukprot:74222-Chlamydomonas_euryale.AAC.5
MPPHARASRPRPCCHQAQQPNNPATLGLLLPLLCGRRAPARSLQRAPSMPTPHRARPLPPPPAQRFGLVALPPAT